MLLKYKASTIDMIEQEKKQPLENIIGDVTVKNLAYLIEKGYVNEDGRIGCSHNVALAAIDEFIENGNDKIDLIMEVYGALQKCGFLPKALNLQEAYNQQLEEMKK